MQTAKLLDILGNENRRRILELLAGRPCYVSEISDRINVAPKAVISHLSILEEAGLVEYFVDRQRRKYFHIAEDFHLEVSISPFSFASDADAISDEEFDDESLQMIVQGFSDLDRQLTRVKLNDLVDTLQKLRKLQEELTAAQRYAQRMITEVTGRCVEAIDELAADPVDAEILLLSARGINDVESIVDRLEITESEFSSRLKNLRKERIIKIKANRIYLDLEK